MNVNANLMMTTAEECGELIQAISKYCRFGPEDLCEETGAVYDNAEQIITEFYQLQAMIEMLQDRGILPIVDLIGQYNIKDAKKQKVNHYMTLSEKRGFVNGINS